MHSMLDALGIAVGTDKSRLVQDYLRQYERLLSPFVGRPITLLEIGVHNGASLELWRRYFPMASIVAVDIEPSAVHFARDRVTVEIGSQYDGDFLRSLAAKYAPDIIVDDGSHIDEHQVFSFEHLFPALAPGGVYIVEDLQGLAEDKAANYFCTMQRECLSRRVRSDVSAIESIRGTVAVWKSSSDDLDQNFSALRALVSTSDLKESLLHLAMYIERMDGPTDMALAVTREMITAEPRNPWAFFHLSKLLLKTGETDAAVRAAETAVDVALGGGEPFRSHLKALLNLKRDSGVTRLGA